MPKKQQDEPKRAIRSFKDLKTAFSKPLKTIGFYMFLGPEASQESLKRPKKAPKTNQRAPKPKEKP